MQGPTQQIVSKQLDLNVTRNIYPKPPTIVSDNSTQLYVNIVNTRPSAPTYNHDFNIVWEFTIGDGKTPLRKSFGGTFKCDICLWWTSKDSELPLFDFRQTWYITLASADAALRFIGPALHRHFMNAGSTRSYVRYTITQVLNAFNVQALKLPISVSLKGVAYRSQKTDGALEPGDQLNSSVAAQVSAEYGKIVNKDFD